MTNKSDRRQVLKWLGISFLGGSMFTVGSGCGGDSRDETEKGGTAETETQTKADQPNHPVPHPGNESLPESEANGKSLSGATRSPGAQADPESPGVGLEHMPKGNQYCGNCSLYVPDQDGDGYGACLSVAGKIHPCDWCILYTEHTGEGSVSCGQA